MPTQEPSRQFQPGRIHRKAWSASGINRHDPGPTSHGLRFPSRGCVARPELLPEDSFQHSAAGSAGVQQYRICTALSSSGYWQAGRCVSSGTVWGAREASGVLFRMRGAVSGVPE